MDSMSFLSSAACAGDKELREFCAEDGELRESRATPMANSAANPTAENFNLMPSPLFATGTKKTGAGFSPVLATSRGIIEPFSDLPPQ